MIDRDNIIRMAREAGLYVGTNISGVTLVGAAKSNGLLIHMTINDLERFAVLVAAAEREACAQVCEQTYPTTLDGDLPCYETPEEFAAAIRARSQA